MKNKLIWQKNIRVEQLDEIVVFIDMEADTKFNDENKSRMELIESKFTLATAMYKLAEKIDQMFEGEVVKLPVTIEEVEAVIADLEFFTKEGMTEFVERQSIRLDEVKEQLQFIEKATDLIDKLFTDEAKVRETATRDDEQEAIKVVEKIMNEDIQAKLLDKLAIIDQAITKVEEEEAKRKAAEERKKKEEEARKKVEKSIGDFAGYYMAEDGFLCHITDKRFDCFMPNSDVFGFNEIVEIIHNAGNEIKLTIKTAENELIQLDWRLLDGGKVIDLGERMKRITKETYDCAQVLGCLGENSDLSPFQ